MSGVQRLLKAAGKVRVVTQTVTCLALAYGLYRTVNGHGVYFKVAHTAPAEKISVVNYPKTIPTMQRFPFDHGPLYTKRTNPPRYDGVAKEKPSEPLAPQPCVIAYTKAHSLFLVIGVKEEAKPKEVAKAVTKLQEYVKEVEEIAKGTCGDVRVHAGVGFGPEFFTKITGGPLLYSNSRQELISSGQVGGDIIVHAKANQVDQLRRLAKRVLKNLPKGSMAWAETTYAVHNDPEEATKKQAGTEPLTIINYNYIREREQMSMFPMWKPVDMKSRKMLFVTDPGIENTENKRTMAAVDPLTGGSYAMTQKWVHEVKVMDHQGEIALNEWVDKAWEEAAGRPADRRLRAQISTGEVRPTRSVEHWMNRAFKDCNTIQDKSLKLQNRTGADNIHVVCLPGNPEPVPPFQLLRQAVSYHDNSTGENGLFFVTFAANPRHNDVLLDRMIASTSGGGMLNQYCHNVFKISRNVRSAMWYFPGERELFEIKKRALDE